MKRPPPSSGARDGRLAWIIVSVCGLFTAGLFVLGVMIVVHSVPPFDPRPRAGQRAARPRPMMPIPPDTAIPVGDPTGWPAKAARPAEQLARGEGGTVRVTLAVNDDGVPTGCSVAQSSGYDDLDYATCNAMLWAADFQPVRRITANAPPHGVRYWTSPPVDWSRVR